MVELAGGRRYWTALGRAVCLVVTMEHQNTGKLIIWPISPRPAGVVAATEQIPEMEHFQSKLFFWKFYISTAGTASTSVCGVLWL